MNDRRIRAILYWGNGLLIVLVIFWMGLLTTTVLSTAKTVAAVNERQIEAVKVQNEIQLCAQHDIVQAVKQIGIRLGLPVEDIIPPDVEGMDCP